MCNLQREELQGNSRTNTLQVRVMDVPIRKATAVPKQNKTQSMPRGHLLPKATPD